MCEIDKKSNRFSVSFSNENDIRTLFIKDIESPKLKISHIKTSNGFKLSDNYEWLPISFKSYDFFDFKKLNDLANKKNEDLNLEIKIKKLGLTGNTLENWLIKAKKIEINRIDGNIFFEIKILPSHINLEY